MHPTLSRIINHLEAIRSKSSPNQITVPNKYLVNIDSNMQGDLYTKCDYTRAIPCMAKNCHFKLYFQTFFKDQVPWELPATPTSGTCIVCTKLKQREITFLDIRIKTNNSIDLNVPDFGTYTSQR